MARITNDVPPFMTVEGIPAKVRGLNTVGLRRAEFTLQARMELKRLLRDIYCSPMTVSQAVAAAEATDLSEVGRELLEFFKGSKRDVTGQQDAVSHHHAVADVAIVGDVRAGHEEIVVADRRFALVVQAAVDADVLANDVAVADDQPGRGAVEAEVLRWETDGGAGINLILDAHDRGPLDVDHRPDLAAVANGDAGLDDGIGADLNVGADLGLGVDDRGGVDV
jgi:hypothetical protein